MIFRWFCVCSIPKFESIIFVPSFYLFSTHAIACSTFRFLQFYLFLSAFLQHCPPILLNSYVHGFLGFHQNFLLHQCNVFLVLVVGVKIWKIVLASCNVFFFLIKANSMVILHVNSFKKDKSILKRVTRKHLAYDFSFTFDY